MMSQGGTIKHFLEFSCCALTGASREPGLRGTSHNQYWILSDLDREAEAASYFRNVQAHTLSKFYCNILLQPCK